MFSPRGSVRLIAVGALLTCVPAVRYTTTGQLLWLRGKSTELLKRAEYRPGATNPDLGSCLVGNDQLREAHGLKF